MRRKKRNSPTLVSNLYLRKSCAISDDVVPLFLVELFFNFPKLRLAYCLYLDFLNSLVVCENSFIFIFTYFRQAYRGVRREEGKVRGHRRCSANIARGETENAVANRSTSE